MRTLSRLHSRHLSALAALTFVGLTGTTGGAIAGGPSSQFDLNGDVVTPGGRYVSNLVALEVFTAPVPEPATWMLLVGPLPILAFLRSRRRTFASRQATHCRTRRADTASE